ncbi:unnamed protein product [Echinostoma caproni]|uniref:SH2 domain-containing protein n=1 Tax=Echinostoma caproni TaxID=27848 RepID=A0A183AM51_9TREM|nr:unnamed protein product [Echinostoma caproni]
MGVKLNLSLAMNGASETGDMTNSLPGSIVNRKTSNPNASVSPYYRSSTTGGGTVQTQANNVNCKTPALVPPQVPAHQNQSHINGTLRSGTDSGPSGTRLKRGEQTASPGTIVSGLPTNELDNGSTDDDSWEARHGRVVSELTSARFVDPSSLTLNEPTSTGSVRTVGQPLSVLTGADSQQRVGHHHHHTDTFFTASPSAPLSSVSQVTPTGASVSPSIHSLIPSSLEMLPLEEQPWFHRSLTRLEAEELLRNQPEGSFLVRNSETCPNDYSLTIKHKTFLHMKISRNAAGQYILGEYSQPYAAVPQMIYHYARTLVPVRGAESVTLTHPVCTRLP